jgi:hypothetical protein
VHPPNLYGKSLSGVLDAQFKLPPPDSVSAVAVCITPPPGGHVHRLTRTAAVVSISTAHELAIARGSHGGSPNVLIAVIALFAIGLLIVLVPEGFWRMLGNLLFTLGLIIGVLAFLSQFV